MLADRTLRLATALAHGLPGVVLELGCTGGERVTVAHGRLDTTLDPCRLRASVLAPTVAGVPRLADTVESVRVRSGAVDLGGGLYARGHPAAEERCFVTTLPHPSVAALLAACPLPGGRDAVQAVMRVDEELGVVLVRIATSSDGGIGVLDEVAAWALTACLVEELIVECCHPADRRPRRR